MFSGMYTCHLWGLGILSVLGPVLFCVGIVLGYLMRGDDDDHTFRVA